MTSFDFTRPMVVWAAPSCMRRGMYLRSLSFLLFLIALSCNSASFGQSAKVLIRAPICAAQSKSCDADISLAQALKSNQKIARALGRCIAAKKKEKEEMEQRLKEAESIGSPGELALALGDSIPSLSSVYICTVFTRLKPECTRELPDATDVDWASVETVKDGPDAMRDLRDRAANGKVVNGQIVVEALESKPGEQHLALCKVRTIKGAHGPPHDCQTVAIITPSRTLMRAELVESLDLGGCETASMIRVSGGIDVTFVVQTRLDPTRFSDSIYRTLTTQLGFQSETNITKDDRGKITNISIRSTAPYRESPILKNGWRESIDFDVDLTVSDNRINVWAFSRPMVCRQAAGQSIEYHGPDDAQRATYATVLNDDVASAIMKACTSAKQIDSKTIVCR